MKANFRTSFLGTFSPKNMSIKLEDSIIVDQRCDSFIVTFKRREFVNGKGMGYSIFKELEIPMKTAKREVIRTIRNYYNLNLKHTK